MDVTCSRLRVKLCKLVQFLRLDVMRVELTRIYFLMRLQSMLSCLSCHRVLLVMRQVSSMLVCRLFVGLRSNLNRLISVVVDALVTHYFLQHLQLVLSAISFQLLFLHKLTLWLLTHDYRPAKLLRLCKVLALRNRLSGLGGASDFAVRYF